MSLIERAFTESLHPRGTGAVGGQFVAAGAGASKAAPPGKRPAARPRQRPAGKRPAGNLAFDGRRGPGYGQKNGDKRVKNLQTALNRLGLTDSSGKKLAVDGKLGPKTTAAIKKAQRALGLKADGVVTPALLAKLIKAKKLEKAKPIKKAAPVKKAAPPRQATPAPRRSGRGGPKAAPRTVQVGS
jgi:peptidoglycan hydrolase-like protein with peptidoglycan-binding domain